MSAKPEATATPTRFLVVSPSYQCAPWVERSLRSLLNQSYPHFRHVLIDDASSDGTLEVAARCTGDDPRFLRIARPERQLAVANFVHAIRSVAGAPEEVIVVLDGDDWLKHPQVLERLAAVYADPEVWLTYGSHELAYPPRRRDRWLRKTVRGKVYRYPEVVSELGYYRYYDFIAAHLRSYRRFLWDAIRDEDLRDSDGGYLRSGADAATMWPMLEMATPRHWRYLDEVLYVYNNRHSLSDNRPGAARREQLRAALIVRARPPYAPLQRAAGASA